MMRQQPEGTPTRRTTLADVAAAAGVSRALASIVMRGAEGAGEATRLRVLEVARELGYRPDSRARLLRSSRTRLLGVTFTLSEPFHGEVVESIYAAAEADGFDVVLSAVGARRPESRAVESLLDAGIEAALMIAPSSAPDLLAAYARQVPVISLLSTTSAEGVDVVRSDDGAGVRAAVEHLVSLGHRNVVHIDGAGAVAADERSAAYRAAMQEYGLSANIRVLHGGAHEEDGLRAAGELVAGSIPDAVVAFNDRCALGVLEAVRRAGLNVPEDLSVTGYDDSQLSRLSHVQLTSVSQDAPRLAAAAVACAAARLASQEPKDLVHQPQLVVRETTGPAPARV
ncbi:LacI family DNA-binding transcriptional regulator [Crystallibacter degradans]|uniref:LacI family DNA-binding transcriptional regulator n=1 Tax=Crystallibacter degradans TaxID=2726743 RepID=UPI001F0FD2A3|nr:LacI family DNA-binding transcriptional regulator [Arthrobacter sp. SF27]